MPVAYSGAYIVYAKYSKWNMRKHPNQNSPLEGTPSELMGELLLDYPDRFEVDSYNIYMDRVEIHMERVRIFSGFWEE